MPPEAKTWVDYHPVYLDLRTRQILIVGGGSIALEKLHSFQHLLGSRSDPLDCGDPAPLSPSEPASAHTDNLDCGDPAPLSISEPASACFEKGRGGADNSTESHDTVKVAPGRRSLKPDRPRITVVSPDALPEIRAWHDQGLLRWLPREFQDADIDDAYMVIAATDDPELNARIYTLGDKANRLTNSVDDPAHCNFIMAAIGRQGPMQIAVSSAGCSPALAQRVRHRILSEILTEEVGDLAAFLGERRAEVKSRLPGYRIRQAFWEHVIDSEVPDLLRTDPAAANDLFLDMLKDAVAAAPGDFRRRKGKVYLIGAGPGDPELITLKAIRALQRADVVLYDRLVNPKLLTHAPKTAEKIYVGKEVGFRSGMAKDDVSPRVAAGCSSRRDNIVTADNDVPSAPDDVILPALVTTGSLRRTSSEPQSGVSEARQAQINRLMIEHASQGRTVVRLKGGDPFVFGRGGEEMIALQNAGIEIEVIPGVSSAIAAPAAAGIPVTHRGVSTSFAVFAGHEADGRDDVPWTAAAQIPTAVFLMGVDRLPRIIANLINAGRSPETPAAVISNATLPTQQVATGTLANIADRASAIPSPAVIVVGDVVAIPARRADTAGVGHHRHPVVAG